MAPRTLFYTLALFSVFFNAYGTPSQTASVYSCPSTDEGGYALASTTQNADGTFTCEYVPAGFGFDCTFYSSTGTLKTDADDGWCPGTAVHSQSKRMGHRSPTGVYEYAKRKREARRAAPTPAPVPRNMAVRSQLKRDRAPDS